ncbi:hypothetical protein BOTBODRAFT_627162 [Botryobasidium botryosum FD-172 SS1]|uniref:Uncharacterized protein n=1 Tax=Botryobasidium botryosum (strain FD-172 SS1) TaxID=930990 RepID=A0A067MZ37_BOTB1|nr:hypothetical protein BOTBODRAFT_627162 [Botryobasidium botryosum FD-172 SS1]
MDTLVFIYLLSTPNFAMSVNDVPSLADRDAGAPFTDNRITLQWFAEIDPRVLAMALHNKDARQPRDMDRWPPAYIVNYLYGCLVFQKWGAREVDPLMEAANTYYYGSVRDDGEGFENTPGNLRESERNTDTRQREARDRKASRRQGGQGASPQGRRTMEEVMHIVSTFWACAPVKDPFTGSYERPPRAESGYMGMACESILLCSYINASSHLEPREGFTSANIVMGDKSATLSASYGISYSPASAFV